jgi:uridine kinase
MEKHHLIIGITGGSGSGKTSLIQKLKSEFGTNEVCIISQDDYYRPRDEQEIDNRGIRNFDRPDSIDKKAFRHDIGQLLNGHTVYRQEYTFNNQKHTPGTLQFDPAPVIVVEGLFVLHFKKIRKMLDLRVFLHAKENLKVIRRIRRDQIERNYPLDDVLYRYEHHVLPTFERYIQPYIEQCDLIINNNERFDTGLHVLIGYIRQWLTQPRPLSALGSSDEEKASGPPAYAGEE